MEILELINTILEILKLSGTKNQQNGRHRGKNQWPGRKNNRNYLI